MCHKILNCATYTKTNNKTWPPQTIPQRFDQLFNANRISKTWFRWKTCGKLLGYPWQSDLSFWTIKAQRAILNGIEGFVHSIIRRRRKLLIGAHSCPSTLPIRTRSTVKELDSSVATTALLIGTEVRRIARDMAASSCVRASLLFQPYMKLSLVTRAFSSCGAFLLWALWCELWTIIPNPENNVYPFWLNLSIFHYHFFSSSFCSVFSPPNVFAPTFAFF